MRRLSILYPFMIMLVVTACSNNPKPAETAAIPAADTTAAKPSLTPYTGMSISFTVRDYDKWHPGYAAHDSARKAAGLTSSAVGRGLDNDKWVSVYCMVSDLQKAKDFAASPDLKAAMDKSGVNSKPTIDYWNVLRDDTSTIPQKERIMIRHHVKDFDTWLKAYDAEGPAKRAENGMVDRFLARSLDDPNTVLILFAITDMAKAKARVASPDLKKVMTDAGVDSAPEITYFKWVE